MPLEEVAGAAARQQVVAEAAEQLQRAVSRAGRVGDLVAEARQQVVTAAAEQLDEAGAGGHADVDVLVDVRRGGAAEIHRATRARADLVVAGRAGDPEDAR